MYYVLHERNNSNGVLTLENAHTYIHTYIHIIIIMMLKKMPTKIISMLLLLLSWYGQGTMNYQGAYI